MIILLRSVVRGRIDEVAAALVCVAAVFVAVAGFFRGKVFAAGALVRAAEARGRFGGVVPLREGDGEGAVGRGVLDFFLFESGGDVDVG